MLFHLNLLDLFLQGEIFGQYAFYVLLQNLFLGSFLHKIKVFPIGFKNQ
jgi:hypothetical protein